MRSGGLSALVLGTAFISGCTPTKVSLTQTTSLESKPSFSPVPSLDSFVPARWDTKPTYSYSKSILVRDGGSLKGEFLVYPEGLSFVTDGNGFQIGRISYSEIMGVECGNVGWEKYLDLEIKNKGLYRVILPWDSAVLCLWKEISDRAAYVRSLD